MSELNPELELTIDPKAVIDGFCWAYCKGLTEGLEELLNQEKPYLVFFRETSVRSYMTELPLGMVRKLQAQLRENPVELILLNDVRDLVERANIHLRLFINK